MVIFTNPVTPNAATVPPVLEDVTVPTNQAAVSATFNEPMDSGTIILANFTLTYLKAGILTPVSGTVTYVMSTNTLVFHLAASALPLATGTEYTATITGGDLGVRSSAGQPMASSYSWVFETGVAADITPPELVRTAPGDTAVGVEAINVPLNQAVHATFSKAMDSSTLTTATFLLYEGTTATGTPLSAKPITYDDTTLIATLTLTAQLLPSTFYTATVTDLATDTAGNPLGNTPTSPFTNPWTFKTGLAAVPPPVVLGPFILPFGGFGGNAGMTNQGIHTVINGDIGTTAASSLMTGFHDTSLPIVGAVWPCTYTETPLKTGQVNGVIDTAAGSTQPTAACPDEGTQTTFNIATEAAGEALTAWNTLAAIPGGLDVSLCPGCGGGLPGELGNRTLAPGIYKSAPGTYDIGASVGPLTLDAKGDSNAYWVFQMASSLTVGDPSGPGVQSVLLINGAKASNIFWQVGSAAVINYGGGGTMVGTIIAYSGVTISSPGVATSSVLTTLDGRALGLDASVTVVNTVINTPPAP
jgi:hypothetical protein